MPQPDYLVIGHVAKDLTNDGYQLGGTVAYSGLTARNLGRRAAVITSAGADLDLSPLFMDMDLVCLPSPVTTTFVNVYEGERRCQYVEAVAQKIEAEAVPSGWRETPIVHLGPIAGEFDEDMIGLFPSSLLCLTPQGWLRQWGNGGRVSPARWNRAEEMLPHVDALIVSEEDLAGRANTLRAHLGLPGLAVLTQGANGAILHDRGRTFHFPARWTQALDATGAGDVFAAAFLVRLDETRNPHEAARFANVAASLSVENAGIASVPERAQIDALIGTL